MLTCGECPIILAETSWGRRLRRWLRVAWRCGLHGRYCEPAGVCSARLDELKRTVAKLKAEIDRREGMPL